MAVPVFSPQNQTGSRKIREPQNIKSKTGFRLVETALLSGYQHPQALPMLLLLLLPQQHSAVAPAAAAIIIAAAAQQKQDPDDVFVPTTKSTHNKIPP